MRRALHRLLTGSAAALIGAAVVGVPASPALAADPAVILHFPDIAVVANSAKINPLYAWIDVPGDPGSAPVQIGKLTVSVDTAGVAEIATVEPADDLAGADGQSCSRAGTVITCTVTDPLVLEAGTNLLPLLALKVTGKPGAAKDSSGKLAFTAQADGDPVVTAESTVTTGEGVDLAGFITKPRSVAPGATVATDLRVANVGPKPVKGVVLAMLGWDPSLLAGKGFSNCTYGILTVCTFDDELATGTTYELSTPMRLRIPSDAAAGSRASALGSWFTPSDFKELLDIAPTSTDAEILGPKGTGPAVRLQAMSVNKSASLAVSAKKSASQAAGKQVDTNPDNNVLISEVVVVGDHKPDVAAVGATVSGTAGDKVAARVGFVNNGPGTLYHWTFDNTDPATHVTVPPGLRAVEVDDRCFPVSSALTDLGALDEDVTGAADYLCSTDGGKTKVKAATLFAFTFQVRDDASAAPGQVRINEDLYTDGDVLDSVGSNNTAKIEVSLSGGSGGGLPVTGANAALLGVAGAALLIAGALGLLLARRRRTRFTA
jgi:LPXTG-motif cell wall-anchored protein